MAPPTTHRAESPPTLSPVLVGACALFFAVAVVVITLVQQHTPPVVEGLFSIGLGPFTFWLLRPGRSFYERSR